MDNKTNNLVDIAAELNTEINNKKKILDGYKGELKSLGESELNGERFKAVVSTYANKTFNADKALAVVKYIGATWLIKETVDTDKLEEAIATGEIDANEFADCIESKNITKIVFKAKK